MRAAMAGGIRSATRAWPVAVILWAWSLLLAGPAFGALLGWLGPRLAHAPAGDVLLERFSIDVYLALMRSSDGAPMSTLFGAIAVMVVAAAVGRAFLIGGLIEVLAPEPEPRQALEGAVMSAGDDVALHEPVIVRRPVLEQFFGGAGRRFLPNLGLLVVTVAVAAITSGAAFFAVNLATAPLDDTVSPILAWLRLLGPLVAAGFVVIFFSLVYDYACISAAQRRRFWAAWLGAVGFVARRLPGTFGLWLLVAVLTAVASAAYLAFRSIVPAGTWPLIVVMIVAQQLFVLVRAWLRAALVGGEIRYAPTGQAAPAAPHRVA